MGNTQVSDFTVDQALNHACNLELAVRHWAGCVYGTDETLRDASVSYLNLALALEAGHGTTQLVYRCEMDEYDIEILTTK